MHRLTDVEFETDCVTYAILLNRQVKVLMVSLEFFVSAMQCFIRSVAENHNHNTLDSIVQYVVQLRNIDIPGLFFRSYYLFTKT